MASLFTRLGSAPPHAFASPGPNASICQFRLKPPFGSMHGGRHYCWSVGEGFARALMSRQVPVARYHSRLGLITGLCNAEDDRLGCGWREPPNGPGPPGCLGLRL
jgi:hypothetical protein